MHFAALVTLCLAVGSAIDSGFHIAPYLQRPEPDGAAVMWETTEPAVGVVEYGDSPELGERASESEARTVHEVRLTGLRPGQRYHYRVRCGEAVSEVASFRTPPGPGTDRWRLVVYGDSRSYPARHEAIADLALRLQPDLVLHTGDQVAKGSVRPLWKSQFFDPAARLLARVPIVTALGNHEERSSNYYDYFALPGNEQFYSMGVGNARLVVLDSSDWGDRPAESKQYEWLKRELGGSRRPTWTIVAFHHPLFSAHDTRSIHRGRWDWCSLFEQLGVDLVLTGHDHFYYRSRPIGRLNDDASARGITHITTAGGGASLYTTKQRSYTAVERAVHHVTVLDFDAASISGQAIDVEGSVFDSFTLTKDPTPPEEFCAMEGYELERSIRRTLERRPPTAIATDQSELAVDERIEVPHTFRVPVTGRVSWLDAAADAAEQSWPVVLEPDRPLEILVKLPRFKLGAGSPRMRLELDDARFRNGEIVFSPLKLWRDIAVHAPAAARPPGVAEALTDPPGNGSGGYALVRSDGNGPASVPARAYFAHSQANLLVTVVVSERRTTVRPAGDGSAPPDPKAVLKGHHVRVLLATAGHHYSFVTTPENVRVAARDGQWELDDVEWTATCRREGGHWLMEFALPLELVGDRERLRVNVVHFDPSASAEDCLSPTFDAGDHPDRIPDFRFGDRSVDRFARLVLD